MVYLVGLAFLDGVLVTLALSVSLPSGGRQGVSPQGIQSNCTWSWCRSGSTPHRHAEWLGGKVLCGSPLCSHLLLSLHVSLLPGAGLWPLCSGSSRLVPRPILSFPWSCQFFFLPWFSATLGVPAS